MGAKKAFVADSDIGFAMLKELMAQMEAGSIDRSYLLEILERKKHASYSISVRHALLKNKMFWEQLDIKVDESVFMSDHVSPFSEYIYIPKVMTLEKAMEIFKNLGQGFSCEIEKQGHSSNEVFHTINRSGYGWQDNYATEISLASADKIDNRYQVKGAVVEVLVMICMQYVFSAESTAPFWTFGGYRDMFFICSDSVDSRNKRAVVRLKDFSTKSIEIMTEDQIDL